jgi:hypothetical protein
MYRVVINGKNFLIELDGELKKCGFYTTRFVDAADQSLAQSEATSIVRNDLFLIENVKNQSDDTPMLFIDGIEYLETYDGTRPGSGFAWYTE